MRVLLYVYPTMATVCNSVIEQYPNFIPFIFSSLPVSVLYSSYLESGILVGVPHRLEQLGELPSPSVPTTTSALTVVASLVFVVMSVYEAYALI